VCGQKLHVAGSHEYFPSGNVGVHTPALTPQRARSHGESRHGGREGWLHAAVIGADDGVVSTASLMIGVAAAAASNAAVLVAGTAGLVAGARPMAAPNSNGGPAQSCFPALRWATSWSMKAV
jgi:hypothetical protein